MPEVNLWWISPMHTHTHTHTHKRKYHKLLMPEVNLGLQVASSLLLLLHPALPLLPCPLQPAFSFAVRLLGLSNAHNKLFVPLEGPLGFFPFMLAKVSLLHTFDFMFHVSRGNSPFVYLRVVTGFSQASAQMPTEAYIAMKSYLKATLFTKDKYFLPTHRKLRVSMSTPLMCLRQSSTHMRSQSQSSQSSI